MSQTAPDNLWGTENTTQFHPIGHAPEAPLGKRYWCDDTHHEIGGSYQDLGKGPEGWYKNIEQIKLFVTSHVRIQCNYIQTCKGML